MNILDILSLHVIVIAREFRSVFCLVRQCTRLGQNCPCHIRQHVRWFAIYISRPLDAILMCVNLLLLPVAKVIWSKLLVSLSVCLYVCLSVIVITAEVCAVGVFLVSMYITGLILGLRPANERRRCYVHTSLIGWRKPRISLVFHVIGGVLHVFTDTFTVHTSFVECMVGFKLHFSKLQI